MDEIDFDYLKQEQEKIEQNLQETQIYLENLGQELMAKSDHNELERAMIKFLKVMGFIKEEEN